MRETEKDPSITLKKSYDFPNFTKNIHEIMYSYQLKK
jgi:hypothetical protein